MRVLVACEYSGRVREAFRKLGHDAWSCDILPAEDGSPYHIQGDAVEAAYGQKWDLMIAHPPCTHLSSAGACYWKEKQADGRQKQAIDFFMALYNAPIEKVVVENPTGFMNTYFRKPDQIVHPWMFGDAENKRTCLWIRGLPNLVHTNVVKVEARGSCIRKTGPKAGRKYNYYFHQGKDGHKRSKSFDGISNAMAEQWGKLA
jgi:site-specific DNA-cytosine methylase